MSDARPYGQAPPGYRLPDATHVGAVRLQVADLDRSMAFYSGVLGLRVAGSDGAVVQLAAHGDDRVLVALHEQPGVAPVPRPGRLGLFHFALLVPDRPALGRFVAHIAERGVYAGSADHAVSEAIYLSDPDGLGIEVYADRPRQSWRSAGRELYMTTEPLDLRDLIRAGASAPWTGLPAGTTMGHVHLHVGALAAAAAFYHAALGLDQVVWSYPGALFLSAGGYHHHLGTNTWAAGASPARADEARLLEWALVLPTRDDVDAAAHSLAASGVVASREGDDVVARDPWGTTVRLRPARP